MSIRTVIADDERPARRRLAELLEREADMEVVAEARDGVEAVEAVLERKPDLLFLDVQMPERDGFEVLRELGPDETPVTVFVTAYDRYAVKAFEARAFDYLLKPFSDERFEAALAHARRYLDERRRPEFQEKVSGLIGGEPPLDRIVLKSAGRVTFLEVDDIEWIEAAGVYVDLHTASKTHLYRSTIGRLTERLDPKRFIRIHRSATVNTARIQSLRPLGHGEHAVLLHSGKRLKLSRSYRRELESWLGQPL
ncbi:MAG: LytTR family DNA-binding domain-containing protein [Bryobacterales bacterium]